MPCWTVGRRGDAFAIHVKWRGGGSGGSRIPDMSTDGVFFRAIACRFPHSSLVCLLVQLEEGWEAEEMDDGRIYYWNVHSEETSWTAPLKPRRPKLSDVYKPAHALKPLLVTEKNEVSISGDVRTFPTVS